MKTTPFIKTLNRWFLGLIFVCASTAETRAESFLIHKFEIKADSSLSQTLFALGDTLKNDYGQIVSFDIEDNALGQIKIPKFQLRRVYLIDLLTALSRISKTNITYENQKLIVTHSEKSASEEDRELKFPSDQTKPLSGDQSVVQLYKLESYLSQGLNDSDTKNLSAENLLDQLELGLGRTAKLRGDLAPATEFHYIKGAKSIFLKAPLQYHLNLSNQLSKLSVEQGEAPLPPPPTSIPERKQSEPGPDAPGVQNPSKVSKVPAATLSQSDIAVLITAIQDLSSVVESLRSQVEGQQVTIDALRKTSPQESE